MPWGGGGVMAPWSHTHVPHARFYELIVRRRARRRGDGPRQVVQERGRQHSANYNITSDAEDKNLLENKRRVPERTTNTSEAQLLENAGLPGRSAPPPTPQEEEPTRPEPASRSCAGAAPCQSGRHKRRNLRKSAGSCSSQRLKRHHACPPKEPDQGPGCSNNGASGTGCRDPPKTFPGGGEQRAGASARGRARAAHASVVPDQPAWCCTKSSSKSRNPEAGSRGSAEGGMVPLREDPLPGSPSLGARWS